MNAPDEDDIETDTVVETRDLDPPPQAHSNTLHLQQAPVGLAPGHSGIQQSNTPYGHPIGQQYYPFPPIQPQASVGTLPGYPPQQVYGHPGQAPAVNPQGYLYPQHRYQVPHGAMSQQQYTPQFAQYQQHHGQVPYSQNYYQTGAVSHPQPMQNQTAMPVGNQYQHPSGAHGLPLATELIYQRPGGPSSFTAVAPATEHFDAALVFAKDDEELADEIAEKMNNLELKDGYKPKVCLSDDPEFTGNAVVKAKPMLKVCTLIFVVLTKRLKEDEAAAVLREEAIGMTRLAPKEDCDDGRRYCVRPLHTLSQDDRRGKYSVPCGLTSIDSVDWYKFGQKSFNKRLIKTFEFFLPYRLKRERESTPFTGSALRDIYSSPNVNIRDQGMATANVQHQFQQSQQSPQQYPDSSINLHSSIPITSASSGNNTPLIPAPSEARTGEPRLARPTEPAHPAAVTEGAGGVHEPSDDFSMRSQEQRSASEGRNTGEASVSTNQSNVTQPVTNSSMLPLEHTRADNVSSQSQTMANAAGHLQATASISSRNEEPTAGTSQAAAGRSLAGEQTLGKKVSSSSAASERTFPPGDSYENVPVSTLQARVGGDSEATHDPSLEQSADVEQQVNPEPRINRQGREQNTPETSSLPTEVDKDSGAESLPMPHTGGDSQTDSGLSIDGTGMDQVSKITPGSEPMSRARTPGDGQELDDLAAHKPTVKLESILKPEKKFEDPSTKDDDTMLKVTTSGPAYRPATCAGPNDADIKNGVPPGETHASTAPQVVHHIHHFPGAAPPGGATEPGQFTDPNFVLPDQLLQGLGQPLPQVPPRRTETPRDRIGESTVHLDTTAPINIVNCNNVQIGTGQINIRSAQPETPDRASGDDSDDDDDGDSDEHNETSPLEDGPQSAPPPYSRYDPRGDPTRDPALYQTEGNQRTTRSDTGHEASNLPGPYQTEVKRRPVAPVTPSNSERLSSNSQTVKQRVTDWAVPGDLSGVSDSSQTEVKQRVANPMVSPEASQSNEAHPDRNRSPVTSRDRPNIGGGQSACSDNRAAGPGQSREEAQDERRVNNPKPTNSEEPSFRVEQMEQRGRSGQEQATSSDLTTSGDQHGIERDQAVSGMDQANAVSGEPVTYNRPAANMSHSPCQNHTGMIQDGPPSHLSSVGASVDLENRGQTIGRGQQRLEGEGQLSPSTDPQNQRQNPSATHRPDVVDRLSTGTSQHERGELAGFSELEDVSSEQDDSGSSYFITSLRDDGRFLVEAASSVSVDDAAPKGDEAMSANHPSRASLSTIEEKSASRMRSPNKRRQDVYLAAGKHCIQNEKQDLPEPQSPDEELD